MCRACKSHNTKVKMCGNNAIMECKDCGHKEHLT